VSSAALGKARRSVRVFHADKAVPRSHVVEALELARRAPSISNTQPWHLVLASGAARERLVTALLNDSRTREPSIPQLHPDLEIFKYEPGEQLYGSPGIARDYAEGRQRPLDSTGGSTTRRLPESCACPATFTTSTVSASACICRRSSSDSPVGGWAHAFRCSSPDFVTSCAKPSSSHPTTRICAASSSDTPSRTSQQPRRPAQVGQRHHRVPRS
jgi:hypothetical protein